MRKDLCTWTLPLYSKKPSFLNLFMKKLTPEHIARAISACMSCLIFRIIASYRTAFPKWASNSTTRASRWLRDCGPIQQFNPAVQDQRYGVKQLQLLDKEV